MHPFIKKMVQLVQATPPSCLSSLRVSPRHAVPWDDQAGWSLACSCGETKGELLGHPLKDCNPNFDGPLVFVSPLAFLCSSCGKTTEIINTKKHGYNAEIAKMEGGVGDSNYVGKGKRKSVPCPKCGGTEYSLTAYFGHPHFDLIEDEPALEPRVQEYFDSFSCFGKCASCGRDSSLVGFELA